MSPENQDVRSDEDLVRTFIHQRDHRAMNAIIVRHGPMVMGVCRSILRNPHAADDAFQATFLVLLNKARSIGKPASLGAWLHGIACRIAKRARAQSLRTLRQESRPLEMISTDPGATDPAVMLPNEETLSLIHDEIAQMPERFRVPLILCAVEGELKEDVARRLGWSVGSVKGRLERARDMLQLRLKKRGVILPAAALTTLLAQQATAQVPAALAAATMTAGMQFVSGTLISGTELTANAIQLSQGAIHAMLLEKLKMVVVLACTAGFVVGGSAVMVRAMFAAPPADTVVAQVAQAGPKPSEANSRLPQKSPSNAAHDNAPHWAGLDEAEIDEISLRHLRAVIFAVHAYLDAKKTFPPASVPNPKLAAEKRLSGLVLLLPYLGVRPSFLPEDHPAWQKWHADNDAARKLFNQIDLGKSWDDPANAVAAKTLVTEFVLPSGAPLRNQKGYAMSHIAFVRGTADSDNGAFPLNPSKPLKISDFPDGTSATLALGQIQEKLGPWIAAGPSTARFLIHPSANSKSPTFGSQFPGCAYVASCDGSCYFLDLKRTDKRIVRFMAERADGEVYNPSSDVFRYSTASEWKALGKVAK
ncbi:sigma-70 family RNA polymerase sigma factor [Schlesneria paludicola]|uniref:sigma-70 family RNA polymerase sigma factor n=1 Tax=Schlesneria paludicola TaxID=360056 RepID=UPI00029A99FF|nr:sigma-70 family RNA polymerase sigma factor [Schlesneria paludicola]